MRVLVEFNVLREEFESCWFWLEGSIFFVDPRPFEDAPGERGANRGVLEGPFCDARETSNCGLCGEILMARLPKLPDCSLLE